MAPAARVTAEEEGAQMQSCSSGHHLLFQMPTLGRHTKGSICAFSVFQSACMQSVQVATESERTAVQAGSRPLRVMIAGAPAAGKGTQCEKIVKKVGLPATHAGRSCAWRTSVTAPGLRT